jgi:hypothetical protein
VRNNGDSVKCEDGPLDERETRRRRVFSRTNSLDLVRVEKEQSQDKYYNACRGGDAIACL